MKVLLSLAVFVGVLAGVAFTPTPEPAPTLPAICQNEPSTSGCPPTDFPARKAQFFTMINDYRIANGVTPIQMRLDSLDASAQWWAEDMLIRGYFGHIRPDGYRADQSACDFGYCFNTYFGQNNSGASCSALGAFNNWKNSPPHNATMLDPVYRVIGIGAAWIYPASISSGCDWVIDLGGTIPCGPQPTPTPALFVCINSEGGTPSPTKTASPTPLRTPTITPTLVPTTAPASPSPTPTLASAPTVTPTLTTSPTAIPPTPTFSPRATPTKRPTPTPRPTPTLTKTPKITKTPKVTKTPKPHS